MIDPLDPLTKERDALFYGLLALSQPTMPDAVTARGLLESLYQAEPPPDWALIKAYVDQAQMGLVGRGGENVVL